MDHRINDKTGQHQYRLNTDNIAAIVRYVVEREKARHAKMGSEGGLHAAGKTISELLGVPVDTGLPQAWATEAWYPSPEKDPLVQTIDNTSVENKTQQAFETPPSFYAADELIRGKPKGRIRNGQRTTGKDPRLAAGYGVAGVAGHGLSEENIKCHNLLHEIFGNAPPNWVKEFNSLAELFAYLGLSR